MTENERRHLLGEAVCGFARAQTTEEAYFPILTGIQEISDLSPSFIEEIKKVFPTIENITPPPKDIREESKEITSHENKVLSVLWEKLGPPLEYSCNRDDQSCVVTLPPHRLKDFFKLPEWKQAVILRAMMRAVNTKFRITGSSFMTTWDVLFSLFYETIEPDHKFDPSDYEEMSEGGIAYRDFPKLRRIEEEAHEAIVAKTAGHESVFEDIVNLQLNLQKSWTRFNTIVLHEEIQADQARIRRILDALIHGKPIKYDTSIPDPKAGYALSQYLKIYNEEMPRPIIEIDQQDNFRKLDPILKKDNFSIDLPIKWLKRIRRELAYCLIEFLMTEGFREYIYTCNKCKGFYSPKILYTSKSDHYFCSDKCRGEYHSSRPEVKEKKAAAQREKYGWEKKQKKAEPQRKK